MQMTKRTKDGPYEYKLIYQGPATAPTQLSATTSGDDSPELASTKSDKEYSVPSGRSGTLRASTPHESASFAPTTPARSNPSHLPDLERHARKCCICSHPDRDAVEGEFIRWDCPRRIAKDYQIADRASFYRHAHATGLYARRRREFARVLENILECVEHSTLEETADVIIRASRVYARLDENGNWVEPRRTHIILTGPAPPQFAGNQELADSFELQPRLAHQEISLTHPKRRDRTSKRKRDLIATADPTRIGIPSDHRESRELSSSRVKKSTHKSKAKKRLIATPPKLENGPTP
ncbi:MAG TPA: hypothetical protein VLH78_00050 [Candidatus Nanoarchaeia archaeon]|nr:hypothetical protein [Candidatus Nanoarchaeia archaeon]